MSKDVIAFVNSWRGRWIISEALSIAIDTLEKVPIPERPVSDINDMKFLRDSMFGLYEAARKAAPGLLEEGE